MSGIKSLVGALTATILLDAGDFCVCAVQTLAVAVTCGAYGGVIMITATRGAMHPGGGSRSPNGSNSIIRNGGATSITITNGTRHGGGGNRSPRGCASITPNGGAITTRASGTPRRGGFSISRNGARASSGMVGRR